MGRYKVNNDGTLGAMISGRGKAEYGASTIRTGAEVIGAVESGANGIVSITFDTPMPDGDYLVEVRPYNTGDRKVTVYANTRNANGFNIIYSNLGSALTNFKIDWYAFKLYTDTEYNNILAAMPSDASASNKVITRSTIGVNSSASHKIASGVSGAQVLAELIWGMIKTDGSPESGVMPVMYEGHDYGIVMYGYLWEGTVKWCVYSLFLIASGTYHFRAKANVGTDEVIIYTA